MREKLMVRKCEWKMGNSTGTEKDTNKRTSQSDSKHIRVSLLVTVFETYRGKPQGSDVPLEPAISPDAELIAPQRAHLRRNGPREKIRVENSLKMPYPMYRKDEFQRSVLTSRASRRERVVVTAVTSRRFHIAPFHVAPFCSRAGPDPCRARTITMRSRV